MDNLTACRLCANKFEGTCQLIFSSFSESFIEKLNMCLPVSIKQCDSLPKQICAQCIERFTNYEQFYYQVLEAEKTLKAEKNNAKVVHLDGNACVECPLCKDGTMQVRNGQVFYDNLFDNECLVKMVHQELQRVESSTVKGLVYICCSCGLDLNTKEDMRLHRCEQNRPGVSPEYDSEAREPEGSGAMEPWGQVVEEMKNANTDELVGENEQEGIKVEEEGEQVEQEVSSVVVNKMMTTVMQSVVQCGVCKLTFVDRDILTQHFLESHMKVMVGKGGAGRTASRARATKRTAGAVDDVQICETCGKGCRSRKALKDHCTYCHPQAMLRCEVCGVLLAKKAQMEVHMRRHTGDLPFRCETCSKDFISRAQLWTHNNFHHGNNRLRCEQCQATGFYTRQELENHVRTKHTRERQFECHVCGKRFMSSGVFYQHRMIHTDIRKYPCTECGRAFRRWGTLRNHVLIHTGERPYTCDVCGRAFRQRGDMRKHRSTQHANIPPDT